MSKINVDHLKETNPAQLQGWIEHLEKEFTSIDAISDDIAQALRNYRSIVIRAYIESLQDEEIVDAMLTGRKPVDFKRGPFIKPTLVPDREV